MQSAVDRFLRRNVPPFGSNRPSSNYGRGRKEQNGANGTTGKGARFVEGDVLWENIEVFAWVRLERIVVPRFVMEHQLKIYTLAKPLVHNRRPMTPDRRQALKERVFHLLKEGTIRKVQHPEWVSNTIHVKLANGTWKVQVDYSSLNIVCAKDMYPFPKEGEELASLMEYPYKCFL
ncbi:hypothetical protein Tco_0876153 [Tanacetum coccineum]|uniref:Uncharacterized protein n=1 Tax=Tanacetum coccineum TaxID=301880 RepID=A0ABQ5BU92_9ASTR